MKNAIASLLLMCTLGACVLHDNPPTNVTPLPEPTAIATPVPVHKEIKIVKANAPSGKLVDFKVQGNLSYLLRQESKSLFLSTFDGKQFSGEEVVTRNCTNNSDLFVTPRMIATDSALYVAWGELKRGKNGIWTMHKMQGADWSSAINILPDHEFEYMELQKTPDGRAVVVAEWIDGPKSGLLVADLTGKILSDNKIVAKTLFSSNGTGTHIYGRFRQVFAANLSNEGALSFNNFPFYMIYVNGFHANEGYYISGWTKDVEKKLPNGKSVFWKKILSILTPAGLRDVVELSEDEGLTAGNATGAIKLQDKIFVVFSAKGKVFVIDLDKNKQELGNGTDILVQQVDENRFDVVTSGSVFSFQYK